VRKGFFAAALSGGTTPSDFYRGLANHQDDFPWSKTHLFLVDERFVPWDHPDSNLGMLRTLFLETVPIPKENVHPVMTSELALEKAADLYEQELQSVFNLTDTMLPEFDCIILGMGADGHTASLFPGEPELQEGQRLVVRIPQGSRPQARISLTLPVINNANHAYFIVTGKQKAGIVKRVIEEHDAALPATLVQPTKGELVFVLDTDAASLLTPM
jgi:6-phosphogluconolactonase